MPERHVTRLRIERNLRGETLAALGRRTGITPGRLSMLERGLARPSPSERSRLADAFEMPEPELFPDGPQP